MDKKILLILGLLILAAVIAAIARGNFKKNSSSSDDLSTVSINGQTYQVEIVSTIEAQARGLSGRERLEKNSGMLFVYSEPASQAFWMKGMKFPIDIIWIKEQKIVGITENAPVDSNLIPKIYNSPGKVDLVLEVAAGTAAATGIKVGDAVKVLY
jgi:uncharacterized protein